MKVRFKSNDDLLLNKRIKLYLLTIIIRATFSEDKKLYMMLCMNYKNARVSKKITLQKELM